MDRVSVPVLAEKLGVSLPAAHRILDREGVLRTGRGVPRFVSADRARRLARSGAPGLSDSETRVLAALLFRFRGVESARKIAAVARISPTTAGKALRRLVELGLVRWEPARTFWAGETIERPAYLLDRDSPLWPEVRDAVTAVRLPEPARQPRVEKVPKQFWHLFWNADPATLRTSAHGAFIARRMLNSDDLRAASWALDNVPEPLVVEAVSGRGVDAKTRFFALNILASTKEE